MKQALITGYVFNASANTIDLSSIDDFDIRRLYAIINVTKNQIIYAVGTPTFGLASIAGNVLTLVYNTSTMSNTDSLLIVYDTVNTDVANAFVTMLTDGVNIPAVKAASTAALATDPSLVIALSPNSPVPAGSNVIGGVTQSGPWTTGRTWNLSNGSDSVAAVQSGSWNLTNITGTISLPTGAATDAELVVINTTLGSPMQNTGGTVTVIQPTGTNLHVIIDSSALPSGAATSANQTNGNQITQVSSLPSIPSGSNSIGNVGLNTGSNIIGSLANISGTISLPTNAAQETGGHLASIDSKLADDGSGNLKVNLETSIPAGSNAIGGVTQSGVWTIGRTWNLSSGSDSVSAVVSGSVTANQGTPAALTAAWPVEVTDGTHTLPTMDAAARAGYQHITDGTNTAAVKASSTAALTTDPSLVIALSPNSSLPAGTNSLGTVGLNAGSSNIGSLNNITGTISLPTGAATSANQTNGNQITQVSSLPSIPAGTNSIGTIGLNAGNNVVGAVTQSGNWSTRTQDGSGNAIGSTSISSINYLNVKAASAGATGAAVPSYAIAIGGSDGTNLQPISATLKGTQGTYAVTTQAMKDSGRTYVVITLDRVTGVTSEALATMTINRGGTVTTGTSYTVTTGKTLRLQSIVSTVIDTTGTVAYGRVRVRAASTVSASSGIIINQDVATTQAGGAGVGTGCGFSQEQSIPDGLEIAGGEQIGISQIMSTTSSTVSVSLIGYEY